MSFPDPSPALDKNRAPMGPEISSSTGAGVWRKAPIPERRKHSLINLVIGAASLISEATLAAKAPH